MTKITALIAVMLLLIGCNESPNTAQKTPNTASAVQGNTQVDNFDSYLIKERAKQQNIQELKARLARLNIKIEQLEQYGQKKNETVFYKTVEPIKNVMVEDRESFKNMIEKAIKASGLNYNHQNIIKRFPVVKNQDFENTGKLLYQPDFDIFINNILIRTGITPVTPEHFSYFISDFEKGEL